MQQGPDDFYNLTLGGSKINQVAYKFGEFILVKNGNNNNLANHETIYTEQG